MHGVAMDVYKKKRQNSKYVSGLDTPKINVVAQKLNSLNLKVVIITNLGQRQKISIKCWKYNRSSQNFTGAFFMLFFII